MSLSPRAIATLGVGFGATAVAYLGLWPVGGPVEPPTVEVADGGLAVRSRPGLTRKLRGYVEREIETEAGPLRVLVPGDWTADDLLQLAMAIALARD